MKVEIWDTRYGTSVRVVARNKGRFVNNKSDKQVVSVILDLDAKGEYKRSKKSYTRKAVKPRV
jgi:hypothetical protein